MTRPRLLHILWAVVAVMTIVTVSIVTQAVSLLADRRPRVEARRSEIARLLALRDQLTTAAAAGRAFRDAPAPTDLSLIELQARLLSAYRDSSKREVSTELPGGQELRRVELTYDAIPIADVMHFVYEAERRTPPWRLAEIELQASARRAGEVRVQLALETVVTSPGERITDR